MALGNSKNHHYSALEWKFVFDNLIQWLSNDFDVLIDIFSQFKHFKRQFVLHYWQDMIHHINV